MAALLSLALGFFVALAVFCFGFGFAFFAGAVGAGLVGFGGASANLNLTGPCGPASRRWGTRFGGFFLFEEGELEAALGAVDAIEQDVDVLADFEDSAVAGASDGTVGVAEEVAVVLQGGDGDDAFDEEVVELDEEAVLGAGEDDAGEVLADAVLHEFDFFPLDELALGVVGSALGLGGFGGYGF